MHNHFKIFIRFLILVFFFFSCSRKDEITFDTSIKESLNKKVDAGELLLDILTNGNIYIFQFEKGSVNIPVDDITKMEPEPERWRTKLTFIDGSILTIPMVGRSLDYMVEKIELNPSGLNPLAALVDVWLPTYGRVEVSVQGKNGNEGTITHLCQETTPRQRVPILGLYADHNNVVDLTFTDMEGNKRGTTRINIRTGAIGVLDFPKWKIVKSQPLKMESGMNLVNYPGQSEIDVSMPYIIDSQGELRWLLLFKSSPKLQKLSFSIGLKRTKKGTFIAGDQSQPRIVELDVFGNLLREWDLQKLGYTFHHEITEAANGNFLINVSKSSAKLNNGQPRINDYIIELDPITGGLVHEWDLADQLDTTRYLKPDAGTPAGFGPSSSNWAHNNSITEMGSGLLATMRYQGILSFSRAGSPNWIISPHKFWGANYQSLLLKPISEDGVSITDPAVINGDASAVGFDWPWGPHTPVVLSEDRILVFDNGYNRNWLPNFDSGVMNYSRVVEYKIDLTKKTVQQLWSYGKELGRQGFSQAVSGVQYLQQTGNVLFCPGMGVLTSLGSGGRIVEINPKNREVVFELEIAASSGFAFHRVTRMPIYPENI